ncbi:MAG: MBL fold metallo-hydrolase [Planctomycetaceae bacterium]|nr:MBL fold metallo-hydrolase [Planctomycetaceae bacterium]
MRMISLQSGSNGNCIFVESCGVRLLIDAGLSGGLTAERLMGVGVDVCSIDGVLISHDHSDHVKNAGVLHRKFQLPIWITQKTNERAAKQNRLGRFGDLNFFRSGERIVFGKLSVETVPTVHDAADGVCFVVDDGDCRLGVMTDLGRTKPISSVLQKNIAQPNCPPTNTNNTDKNSDSQPPCQKMFSDFYTQATLNFPKLNTQTRQSETIVQGQNLSTIPASVYGRSSQIDAKNYVEDYYERVISTLDGLLIESNFDIDMLSAGGYPRELQNRICGKGGHLSNLETARLIKHAGKKLRWVCLGHISKENNTHDTVLNTHREILGKNLPISIASRYETSELLEL